MKPQAMIDTLTEEIRHRKWGRPMVLNNESTLMLLDRAVGEEMNRGFIDDLQYAEPVALTTFRQRSWFQQMMERGANLILRVL